MNLAIDPIAEASMIFDCAQVSPINNRGEGREFGRRRPSRSKNTARDWGLRRELRPGRCQD
eukprot:749249-Hanusia_phi.AAC.1